MRRGSPSVFIFFVLILLYVMPSRAQSNLLLYQSKDGPNDNPAWLLTHEKFSFSIFPFAGTSISYNHHDAVRKMLDIDPDSADEEEFTAVVKDLVSSRQAYLQTEINLINLSLQTKSGTFSLRVRESVYGTARLKGNLLNFFVDASDTLFTLGKQQSFPSEGIHFRQYSLGYATRLIRDKLIVGVRGNLYFGKSFVSTDVSGTIVEDANSFYVRSAGYLNFSGPVRVVERADGTKDLARIEDYSVSDYLKNSKNTGFGLDLGLNYQIDPYLTFTASVTNLGKINFKNNLQALSLDGQNRLSSSQVSKQTLDDGTEVLVKRVDEISLKNTFRNLAEVNDTVVSGMKAPLPILFFGGLNYELSPDWSVGIADRLVKHGDLTYNSLLLSATWQVARQIYVSTGYAAMGTSYLNIPLGIQLKWAKGTAYIATDHVLPFISKSASDIRTLSFGANYYPFHRKVKYKDVPYLPFFKLKKNRRL